MVENTELAVHETHDVFESYDLADEEQIIAEMSGRVTDKYIYTFKQGGQDVTGLSFAGTNWAAREFAKQGEVIRIVSGPKVDIDPSDPDYMLICVIAQRFAVNKETGKEVALDSAPGAKRQWRFMEKKKYNEQGELNGKEVVPDPFWYEKGVSKATRNGKQALMPTDFVKRLISRAIDSKNGKNVQSRNQQYQQRQQQPQQGQGQRPPQQTPPQQPSQGAAQQPAQAKPMGAPPGAAPSAAAPGPVHQGPRSAAAAPQPSSTAVAPAAPAQPVPPPPVQPPVQAASPPPSPPAPPAAPPQQQEMPKDVMVQKLDAVLKAVFATQDTATARQGLHRITGFGSPADMPPDQIRALGNILNGVVKKQSRIDGNKILKNGDNAVLWQGPDLAPPPGGEPLF